MSRFFLIRQLFLASKLCQLMQDDGIKYPIDLCRVVIKICPKLTDFICEYLKLDCIEIVLEAEERATRMRRQNGVKLIAKYQFD